jgi:hypothetical protein
MLSNLFKNAALKVKEKLNLNDHLINKIIISKFNPRWVYFLG